MDFSAISFPFALKQNPSNKQMPKAARGGRPFFVWRSAASSLPLRRGSLAGKIGDGNWMFSRQFIATYLRRVVTPKGSLLVRESDPQNGRNIQVKDLFHKLPRCFGGGIALEPGFVGWKAEGW